VARGKYGEADVKAVHQRVAELVESGANGARIDAFYYCPYHPEGRLKQYMREHPNRKPSPGMLLEAAADLEIDLGRSWMIGDQMRDVQAGSAAGCRTVLLRADAAELSPLDVASTAGVRSLASGGAVDASTGAAVAGGATVKPDFMAASLIDAVRIVAQARQPESGVGGEGGKPAAPVNVPRKWDAAAVAQLQKRSARPASSRAAGEGEARGDGGQGEGLASSGKPASRPFRPWNAPDPEEEGERKAERGASRGKRGRGSATARDEAGEGMDTSVSTETVSEFPGPIAAELARREAERSATAEAAGVSAARSVATAEATERAEAAEDDAALRGDAGATRVLRSILQELRGQRATAGGTTWLVIVAVLLQMGAVFAVVGALWMGASSLELFAKWAVGALMCQLGVIAMLLFDGRRA